MIKYKYLLLGCALCIVFCLPYFILGQNAYITIHDFLDVTIGHIQNVVNNGQFFDLDTKTPLLYGVNRSTIAFTSPFELKALFFAILPSYWAIVANIVVVKTVAFIGMFLLLNVYFVQKRVLLPFVISIVYSFIPFYIEYGISSAGIPLLVYALINLYQNKAMLVGFLIVFFYSIYSVFAMGGFFVCLMLTATIIVLWYKEKSISLPLLASLVVLSLVYTLINWSLIKGFFIPSEFVSHRTAWVNNMSIVSLSKYILFNSILISQYHAGAFIAFPLIGVYLIVWFLYRNKYKSLDVMLSTFVVLIFLVFIGAFSKTLPFSFFTSFKFERFYFFYPALVFVLLAMSCSILLDYKKTLSVIFILVVSAVCVGCKNTEYINNLKLLFSQPIGVPTYSQFYDEKLFAKISVELNCQQGYTTKVVSLGMFPSIAEYNGFWCLDAYYNSYSLDYKKKFRRVIERELNKNEEMKNTFDNWGNRCYIYSAELFNLKRRFLCSRDSKLSVNHLSIDTKVLKEMGCDYILSAVEIRNYRELNLHYINSYTADHSFWEIYVYKV